MRSGINCAAFSSATANVCYLEEKRWSECSELLLLRVPNISVVQDPKRWCTRMFLSHLRHANTRENTAASDPCGRADFGFTSSDPTANKLGSKHSRSSLVEESMEWKQFNTATSCKLITTITWCVVAPAFISSRSSGSSGKQTRNRHI